MVSVSFRPIFRLIGVTLAGAVGLAIFSLPVHADPHAVFYTVTAQQQLFFNTLAALDQADYVEPAQNTVGAPAGTSRQELLDQRKQAGFSQESDPLVNSTQTKLSGIITRNVTLEGNDVWTAYLALQNAINRKRTTASDELAKIDCQLGLGVEGCDPNDVSALKEQDKAFVTRPDQVAAQPYLRGAVGQYASGLSEYDDLLKKTLKDGSGPLSYNKDIADLRKNNKNDTNKKDSIDTLLDTMAGSFLSAPIDSHVLDNVIFNDDGSVSVDSGSPLDESNINSDTYIEDYMSKVAAVSDMPYHLLEAGTSAELAVKDFYDSPAVVGPGGGKGDLKAEKSDSGGVTAKVILPAGVKDALAQEPVHQLANFELNSNYAPAAQNAQPEGNQQVTPNDSDGSVEGISSDQTSNGVSANKATAQVAGISTDDSTEDPDLHGVTKELDPQSLPEAFHHEQAPSNYLQLLGVGRDGAGCGCSLHNAVNDFGQKIISRINKKVSL